MVLPLQGVISFCVTPSPRALPLGWEILPLRGVCARSALWDACVACRSKNCDVIPFTYYMIGVNKRIETF